MPIISISECFSCQLSCILINLCLYLRFTSKIFFSIDKTSVCQGWLWRGRLKKIIGFLGGQQIHWLADSTFLSIHLSAVNIQ